MSKRPPYTGPILEAFGLRKEFDHPAGALEVLKGVHFQVPAGSLNFIIGRSGSGKSTLLHLLGCLDRPTDGKILFEGEDVTAMREGKRSRIRNRRIGFVFQFYHLLPELTLYENVILPSLIAGKRQDAWARELLRRVRLLSRQHHYPAELSGGEQQRAAIARALVNRPSLVLCDEPTGNLDQDTAESVIQLLFELHREEGQALVVVTHDEALAWRSPAVFRLAEGVLVPQEKKPVPIEKVL